MEALMTGTLVAIFVPLGYVLGGLITARAILGHYIRPNGTFRFEDDAPTKATVSGIFWPYVLAYVTGRWFSIRCVKWIVMPKAWHDAQRAQRERTARWAREIAAQNADKEAKRAEDKARFLAKLNDLPYPQQGGDLVTGEFNPLGRPPMCEGK